MAFTYNNYQESDAVKKARQNLQNNSVYKESQEVINARNNLNNLQGPGEYQSQYQGMISNLMGQISNRKPFTYDLNGDALYQQYKDQYMRQGKLAMMGTLGQASALTGGYGNSYAATAGNQAYQSSLQNLNDIVPELYRMALDKYNTEGQDLYNQYSMYAQQEAQDYGKYRDTVSDYQTNRAYLTDVYNNARNFDYSKFTDNRDYLAQQYSNERTYDYGQYSDAYQRAFAAYQQGVADDQWAKEYALQQAQLAKSGRSGGGSGSRGGGSSSSSSNSGYVEDYSSWGASDWENFFAGIRKTEGRAAAEAAMLEFRKEGILPSRMMNYAAVGATGGSIGGY